MMKILLFQFGLLIFLFYEKCLADQAKTDLFQETIVVTNAESELGSAISKKLAEDYNLILTGNDISKLYQLQKELKAQYPGQYDIYTLDYLNNASTADFRKALPYTHDSLAGLVLLTPRKELTKEFSLDPTELLQLFQTAYIGPLDVLEAVVPRMNKKGKIIIINENNAFPFSVNDDPARILPTVWAEFTQFKSKQLDQKGIVVKIFNPEISMPTLQTLTEGNIRFNPQPIMAAAAKPSSLHDSQLKTVENVKSFFIDETIIPPFHDEELFEETITGEEEMNEKQIVDE